ncbi:MAG: D-alanyl-D-alanine carboxypeptidase, partial [Pseudobdellovibrionaceae bacterium]
KKTLRSHLSVNQYQYSLLRKRASESDVQLLTTYKLQVKNFDFKSSADFKQDAESNKNLQTFTMQSAPLYRYLKAMNLVSNNHVADFLFNLIGGAAGYKQFIKDRLDYSTNDIEMFNGSGDNVPTRKGSLYNSASCTAVVNIVLDLRRLLMSVPKNDNAESTKKYFDLEDVMSISEADSEGEHGSIHSTIQRYNDLDTSLIAKTGTLNKYSSLAGMISTEKGDLYFSIVVSKFSQKENDSAKVVIKKNVMSIIKKFSGVSPIDTYTPLAFVPFDADSKLVEYTGTNQSITGLAKN